MLEDSFSCDELWPQPYNHLYVSLRSGRSIGKNSDVDIDSVPAVPFDTEPAVQPEEVEPLPTDEAPAEESAEAAARLENTANEIPDTSTDTDDLPEVDMDRLLRVTFGKVLRYALTSTELIHQDSTVQPISLPNVGPNTPCSSSLKGTHPRVH